MLRAVVTAAVLALVCACPPADPRPPNAEEFITALLAASVACDDGRLKDFEPVFLQAQLDAQVQVGIEVFTRNLNNEHVEFVRGAYDGCLADARANNCSELGSRTGSCSNVFHGRLPPEAVCAESVECAEGSSCFQERDQCGVCRTDAVNGESCADRNCFGGSFCSEAGTCTPEPEPLGVAEGDLCAAFSGCGGVVSGLVCIDTACAPITPVGEGEACEVGGDADLHCVNSSSTHQCDAGVCTRRPGLGEPCAANGSCDATVAACVNGTCEDAGYAGDSCSNGFGCRLGVSCQAGTCVAFADVPAPPTCE